MAETIVYNVWHTNPYEYLVLAYFFLAGMGGGSFLVSAFAKILGDERYKHITNIGVISSIILVGAGGICLFFDLGRHFRVYLMFLHFNPTSPISWGSVIIGLFTFCCFAFMYYLFVTKNDRKARLWASIGIVISVILTSYTGLLLSMAKARPLWHSAIMAPLFLVSSCISGVALILLVANLLGKYSPRDQVMRLLGRILIVLILIDIFFLSDMYVLYVGLSEAQEVALLILFGKFAFLFWGVELLLGSVLPVVILQNKKSAYAKGWQVLASVLALVGVFTMRYIILMVGQHLPLS
jgi:formate-dependent nitrite reductase membrane component NrfD